MTVSLIIPSRLQPNPISEAGNLWLDRALMSVARQTLPPTEIFVGLDAGARENVPARFVRGPLYVLFISAAKAGQAAALNAAARASTGEWLAFLEDDDQWEPSFLETAMSLAGDERAGKFDFVTSNQREVDEAGGFVRYNDFATPSGWLIRASTWGDLGGFDESFRFHVDTDFLGRANAAKVRRCHIVEAGALSIDASADVPGEAHRRVEWIQAVGAHSALVESTEREPLVVRTVNQGGGMWTIANNPAAAAVSREEHARMKAKYGSVPW